MGGIMNPPPTAGPSTTSASQRFPSFPSRIPPMATNNLANIIDSVNDAFFWNRDIAKNERLAIARQIADRQGQRGAYADTFALFDHERRDGIRLFTGEPTKSAAARHIAGEEACRALRLLNVRDKH